MHSPYYYCFSCPIGVCHTMVHDTWLLISWSDAFLSCTHILSYMVIIYQSRVSVHDGKRLSSVKRNVTQSSFIHFNSLWRNCQWLSLHSTTAREEVVFDYELSIDLFIILTTVVFFLGDILTTRRIQLSQITCLPPYKILIIKCF